MQVLARIIKQYPLQKREYTDNRGEKKVFKWMGFLLSTGSDTLYGEVTGEQAENMEALDTQYIYGVDFCCTGRTYTDQSGNQRGSTELNIRKIAAI